MFIFDVIQALILALVTAPARLILGVFNLPERVGSLFGAG